MKTIEEKVIERVNELCFQKHITIYELAIRAHMPISTIKCILYHKTKSTSIGSIDKLAKGLDMSIRDFFESKMFEDNHQHL